MSRGSQGGNTPRQANRNSRSVTPSAGQRASQSNGARTNAVTSGSANWGVDDDDISNDEVFEFLEGLVAGFRDAWATQNANREADQASGSGTPSKVPRRGGDQGLGPWVELDALGKAPPPAEQKSRTQASRGYPAQSPASYPTQSPATPRDLATPSTPRGGAFEETQRPLEVGTSGPSPSRSAASRTDGGNRNILAALSGTSNVMRLHAIRSFFEETCGTVANAFDLMASAALNSRGGGTAEDRLNYLFDEEEFATVLTGMGYGIDATPEWWKALFTNIDADKDGTISLQDMYDSLVLDLAVL